MDRLTGGPPEHHSVVLEARHLTLRETFQRFWPDARPLRWWLVVGIVLSSLGSAVTVVEISLFQYVVDDVLATGDLDPLLWLGSAYIGLTLVAGVLSGARSYLSTWTSHTFLVRLRSRVFEQVLSLPQEVHDRARLGDCLSRLTSDTGAVQSLMLSSVTALVSTTITIVFYVVALVRLDGWLTVGSLVVIPVFWFVSHRFARLIKRNAREMRRRGGSLSAIAHEQLGHAALVQAFGREGEAARDFTRQNVGIKEAALASTRIRGLFTPIVDVAELCGVLLVIFLGTHAVSSGRLSLGGLMAFLTLMIQLYRPLRSLASMGPSVFADLAGCERVAELLDEEPPTELPDAPVLPSGPAWVELDGVTLTYPGATEPALRAVTLRLAPGEIVALSGPSGAGKSSILKLLLRAVEPSTGAVRISGERIDEVTLRSLRDAIALVPQETTLLDMSVLENIGFARRDATRRQIVAAARAAAADEFISALPQGYDTPTGTEGRTLSGGQRQRIALARAFLRTSPVMLLDEPTTGLDPKTARQVLSPLRRARDQGRTVIVATHDPIVLEIADRVITLEGGAVASDSGSRRQLRQVST